MMDGNRFYKFRSVLCLIVVFVFFCTFPVFADYSVADFNKDGKLDITDLVLMKKTIATQSSVSSKGMYDIIDSDSGCLFNSEDLVSLTDVILGKTDTFVKSSGAESIDF